ncbi:hypothetical protein J6590_060301 [Homalodisca vitripennis]|nr:hypothetical protein J6590_060301 [Homalodisca vitripennis]
MELVGFRQNARHRKSGRGTDPVTTGEVKSSVRSMTVVEDVKEYDASKPFLANGEMPHFLKRVHTIIVEEAFR